MITIFVDNMPVGFRPFHPTEIRNFVRDVKEVTQGDFDLVIPEKNGNTLTLSYVEQNGNMGVFYFASDTVYIRVVYPGGRFAPDDLAKVIHRHMVIFGAEKTHITFYAEWNGTVSVFRNGG